MLEENGVACPGVFCVGNVDCMAVIVFPGNAHIESAGCVGCPCFSDGGCQVCFDLASKRGKGVCIEIVLSPQMAKS